MLCHWRGASLPLVLRGARCAPRSRGCCGIVCHHTCFLSTCHTVSKRNHRAARVAHICLPSGNRWEAPVLFLLPFDRTLVGPNVETYKLKVIPVGPRASMQFACCRRPAPRVENFEIGAKRASVALGVATRSCKAATSPIVKI